LITKYCSMHVGNGGLHTTTTKNSRSAALLVLLTVAFLASPAVSSQELDNRLPEAAGRVANFLSSRDRGQEILMLMHAFTEYRGHELQRAMRIDGRSSASDGRFELIYRFWWQPGDGITDLAFLCDNYGQLYQIEVIYTNARFNRPFAVTSLSLKLIGRELLDRNKDRLQPWQQRMIGWFIDQADAKGLLKFILGVQQAGG